MTSEFEITESVLRGVPVRALRTTLVRCVALQPLIADGAPDYLFASGRANRYNPCGVRCVYFSEDEATARLEYARRFGTGQSALQPLGIFFAEVSLARVIDLGDADTRDALGIAARELSATWQRAKSPTRLQRLGLATSRGAAVAIRFPSDAARVCGTTGFNVVIFGDCVQHPDAVHILGPTRKPLQKWP